MPSSKISRTRIYLPYDVLREIFIFYISGNEDPKPPMFPVPRIRTIRDLPQLSVSAVCSSWRQAALLTPQLWEDIWIRNLNEAKLSVARKWLSHAQNRPVSIKFSNRCSAKQSWRTVLIDFLSSYRLRALVSAAWMPLHVVLPDLPQRSVADLQSLHILDHAQPLDETIIDIDDIRYPKLTAVRLWGTYKISGWSDSLRIFDGMNVPMTVTEGWNLLLHFPSLNEAIFNLTQYEDDLWPPSAPLIYHDSLHILRLHSEPIGNEVPFSAFIEPLALPDIEEIQTDLAAWSAIAFQSFAHQSNYFPRLRNFILKVPASTIDAGALLALMPSVMSISLCSGIPVTEAVFDQLALDGLANGLLAPRLQSLEVGYISTARAFVDMVELRMRNAQMSNIGIPAPFTQIVFMAPDQGYYNGSESLTAMQQRGIPITSRW